MKNLNIEVGERFSTRVAGPSVVPKNPHPKPEYRCIIECINPAGDTQVVVDKKKEYAATNVMENQEVMLGAPSCTMELTVIGLESIDLPGYVPVKESVGLEATTDTEGYGGMVEWYEKDDAGELNELSNSVSWDNPGETTVVARLEQKYTNMDDEEVVMIGESLEHSITAFEVTNIVIAEESEDTPPLYIDAEERSMPEVTFEFNTDPEVLPSGKMKAEWFLEMIYDEGNYTDFAEPTGIRVPEEDYAEIEGSDRWTIVAEDAGPGESEWGELMGTKATEVAVFVSVDGSKQAYMLGAQYAIMGENPTGDTIQDQVDGSDNSVNHRKRGRLAMVWRESCGEQFSNTASCGGEDPWFPNLNLEDGDDGWGITQLTSPVPTRLQVWNWVENLEEGIEHFDTNYSNTQSTVEGWHDHWTNTDFADTIIEEEVEWGWDPTDVNSDYDVRTEENLQEILNRLENNEITWHDPANLPYDPTEPEDDWPDWAVEDVPPLRDYSGRDNTGREENHLDGKEVSKILNAQAYLQFNAGEGFPAIVGEFGVIRRYIADDTWGNVIGYIDRYDGEPWDN